MQDNSRYFLESSLEEIKKSIYFPTTSFQNPVFFLSSSSSLRFQGPFSSVPLDILPSDNSMYTLNGKMITIDNKKLLKKLY